MSYRNRTYLYYSLRTIVGSKVSLCTMAISKRKLPARMAEYYRRLDGSEAVEHRDELELLSARKDDLLSRMAENDNPQRWKDAHDAYSRYDEARKDFDAYGRTSDQIKMNKARDDLERILTEGYTYEYSAWRQLMSLLDIIRKTKDSEIRRRQKASEMITEHQVQTLIGQLLHIVTTNISSPEERERVLAELRRIKIGV